MTPPKRDATAVAKLVDEHLAYARGLIVQRWGGIVHQHDLEDLMQVGAIGLLDAARRFDPASGVRFQSFAYARILGAAIDYLRTIMGRPGRVTKFRATLATDLRGRHDDECPLQRVPGSAVASELQIERLRTTVRARLRAVMDDRTAEMALLRVFDRKLIGEIARRYDLVDSRVCQLLGPVAARARQIVEHEIEGETA